MTPHMTFDAHALTDLTPDAADRASPGPAFPGSPALGFAAAPETSAPAAVPAANLTAPTVPVRPFAARPRLPDAGLRVQPLDSFVWGGAGTRGPSLPQGRAARVRGDHCLIRVTGGAIRVILPSGAVDHGPGSVIFIPAGTAFATLPQRGAQGQVLLMPRDMAAKSGLPLPATMVVGAGASDAFSADLAALAARGSDPVAAATAVARIELISAELQRLATRPDPETPALPGAEARSIVAAFLDLAGRELGRGRTLADLAEALGTSAAGLEDACRRHRGRGALQLIYDLRLDRARAMLTDGSRSLSQIAADLGFTGIAHLNRVFVAETGRSAEAFRPS